MRKLVLIAALAVALEAAATTSVDVSIAHPLEETLRLSYVEDPVSGRRRLFKLKLREGGRLSFELPLAADTELLLEHGDIRLPLFVGPDDRLAIELDARHGLDSVAFGGSAAADNRFLAAFAKTFPAGERVELGGGFLPFEVERAVLAEAAPADLDRFARWVYADYDARANLIRRLSPGVDTALVGSYRRRTRYRMEVNKAAFMVHNQAVLERDDLVRARSRLRLLDPTERTDPTLLAEPAFRAYLRAYAQQLTLPNSGAHDETNGSALFAAIQSDIGRPWRHFLQSELLVNAFDYLGNPEFGLDHYAAMQRDGVGDRYRSRVEAAYGTVLELAPGALAPNIGMYTPEGEPVSLTELSGQVVYISFWASWCKPCLANFERYDAIRAELAARGVVLLNVSIDDDEFAWRRTLTSAAPRGLNTRATDLEGVKRAYTLAAIPAYYIVDREGRIATLPDGEQRDLVASFEGLLGD